MKSAIPIPIPQRVSPGDIITSNWANQVRDCIQRLTNRKQPDSPNNPVDKFAHMWQVTAGSQADEKYTYNIRAGIVVIQGERLDIDAVVALTGGDVSEDGDNGFIYLKVFRDESSRAYDPTTPPEIEFSPTKIDSDYYSEVITLAEIKYGIITQCRNDEICSQELLIVSNGEFALIPMQANSRNTYDPPAPIT
jgi:hypothetical protein